MSQLNSVGLRLLTKLTDAIASDEATQKTTTRSETINVVGAGGAITAAYEQLRNAADNTEEHLLLQNAVRRFYKQLFITHDEKLVKESGNELAVELTLAGYIPNDSLIKRQLDQISKLATRHYVAYQTLHDQHEISHDMASLWILDTLSSAVTRVISPDLKDAVFLDFASTYLEKFADQDIKALGSIDSNEYGASLFIAIHRALLKSSAATIRAELMERYGVSVNDIPNYVSYNQHIDRLMQASATDKLYRLVDRRGVPMRIIRRMIEDRADFVSLLSRRDAFLEAFEQQVMAEYSNITERINRAIVRSVIFLVITKFIVGIAIEVPYDYWAYGGVLWQPLIINLLFPPLYMIALRLTLTLPGYANTKALVDRVDAILYGDKITLTKTRAAGTGHNQMFSTMYVVSSLAVFTFATWLLLTLGFAFVHIAIFFVFISTASFLGFRLSRLVRELEIVRSASNGLTFIRDFIYLPFVVVGRWMSDKYAKVNLVALILDMLIELPLKTILRLVRQWSAFIDDRKDTI